MKENIMPWSVQEEQRLWEVQRRNEEWYNLKGAHAPPFLNNEKLDQFQRRYIDDMKPHTRNHRDVNPYEVGGSMLPRLLEEVRADAIAEALRPSMVPEGELREVTKTDATGRKIIEWFGSPKTWMSQFANSTKKRLVGIRTETQHGYNPGNLG
jgi:hypothetical protein